MSDKSARKERRAAEIELLQAMYPELVWNEQRQEVKFISSTGASLVLRIPDDYPGSGQPILISALHSDKTDLRASTKSKIEALALPSDEEMLGTVIQTFDEVVTVHDEEILKADDHLESPNKGMTRYKTVVIWLHHLLNTNKRKLALNPTINPEQIVGVTKPGYPGVLVYSGLVEAVDAHVSELKNQRWRVFQVRYEGIIPAAWSFTHSSGIKEVETISEIVQQMEEETDQTTFLQAIGVK